MKGTKGRRKSRGRGGRDDGFLVELLAVLVELGAEGFRISLMSMIF